MTSTITRLAVSPWARRWALIMRACSSGSSKNKSRIFCYILFAIHHSLRIQTSIHYKETDTHNYLHYISFHPRHCKHAIYTTSFYVSDGYVLMMSTFPKRLRRCWPFPNNGAILNRNCIMIFRGSQPSHVTRHNGPNASQCYQC